MSKKLPLEVQKNYTIIDRGESWELRCTVCPERFSLKKPKKGEGIHNGNVVKLLDHAKSHPLPKEEGTDSLVRLPAAQPQTVTSIPPPKQSVAPKLSVAPKAATVTNINSRTKLPPKPESLPPKVVMATTNGRHSVRTDNAPNAYKVEWYGSPALCHMLKVSGFVDPEFARYEHVEKVSDNQYNVVLFAANAKHAQLVGERIIKNYFRNINQG